MSSGQSGAAMEAPPAEELVMFVTSDLSGTARGRSFPARDLAERMEIGVGWVPANQAIDAFNDMAADNPFGPLGDLRLLPATGEIVVPLGGEASPLRLVLCDIVETDGRPWDCCARNFARRALADLEAETGLGVLAAFEQEFTLTGLEAPTPPCFSLRALRAVDPFATRLVAALRSAGIATEHILPEFGPYQFELVCGPKIGLKAADDAILIREIVREVARGLGIGASFAPKMRPEGIGNGVHLHFSLQDRDGRPVTGGAGPDQPVSAMAGRFVAGILAHLPALCALAAPSAVSYLRLVPHHWSAAYACFGERNREAAVRLCPVIEFAGRDRAAQANLEFRVADATSSPYMVLGALVRAGLEGIRRGLPTPPVVNGDPDGLDPGERARLGIRRLPTSLAEAMAAFEADAVARAWLPERMRQAYVSMKRHEIARCAGLDPESLCAKYAGVY